MDGVLDYKTWCTHNRCKYEAPTRCTLGPSNSDLNSSECLAHTQVEWVANSSIIG